jgi:hypothetical protein
LAEAAEAARNQAFVLRFAVQSLDAKALDGSFLAMPHPDSLQALVSNQISGYVGSPPFQNEALARGCRSLLNNRDLFGPLTFSICFAPETYGKKNPMTVRALRASIDRGIALLKSSPDAAAAMLAKDAGGRQSAEVLRKLIVDPNTTFTSELVGVPKLAEFMRSSGFLRKDAGKEQEIRQCRSSVSTATPSGLSFHSPRKSIQRGYGRLTERYRFLSVSLVRRVTSTIFGYRQLRYSACTNDNSLRDISDDSSH